jgi:hypothetical protein
MAYPGAKYVVMEPERYHVFKFYDYRWVWKDLTDPLTGIKKRRRVLEILTNEVDYKPVDMVYSVSSTKHANDLMPLIESGELFKGRWRITRHGTRFETTYTIERISEEKPPPAL